MRVWRASAGGCRSAPSVPWQIRRPPGRRFAIRRAPGPGWRHRARAWSPAAEEILRIDLLQKLSQRPAKIDVLPKRPRNLLHISHAAARSPAAPLPSCTITPGSAGVLLEFRLQQIRRSYRPAWLAVLIGSSDSRQVESSLSGNGASIEPDLLRGCAVNRVNLFAVGVNGLGIATDSRGGPTLK